MYNTSMKNKKRTYFHTSKEAYNDIEEKKIKDLYKLMSLKRFSKYAVAQLVRDSQYQPTLVSAVFRSFVIPIEVLDKEELALAELCYSIGQSLLMEKLHKLALIDNKAYNTLKLFAELKGMIQANKDTSDELVAQLKISLDNTRNPEPKSTNKSTEKAEPLKLVM